MTEKKWKSFCCGGGGGRIWFEEAPGQRISEIRVEQAVKTAAQTIATACPFCLQMFGDAIKAKGYEESIKAMDIAELVAEAIKADTKAKPCYPSPAAPPLA